MEWKESRDREANLNGQAEIKGEQKIGRDTKLLIMVKPEGILLVFPYCLKLFSISMHFFCNLKFLKMF